MIRSLWIWTALLVIGGIYVFGGSSSDKKPREAVRFHEITFEDLFDVDTIYLLCNSWTLDIHLDTPDLPEPFPRSPDGSFEG